MAVLVRRARPADVAQIADLHCAAALTGYRDIFPPEAPKPTPVHSRWDGIISLTIRVLMCSWPSMGRVLLGRWSWPRTRLSPPVWCSNGCMYAPPHGAAGSVRSSTTKLSVRPVVEESGGSTSGSWSGIYEPDPCTKDRLAAGSGP